MKINFALLFLAPFYAATALAHPGDDKLMTLIDDGATLVVQRDINVPSDNKLIIQDGKLHSYYASADMSRPLCTVMVTDRFDEPLERDAFIRAGTQLTQVWHSDDSENISLLKYTTPNGSFVRLHCMQRMRGANFWGIPSIGEFKGIIQGLMHFEFAPSIEL